MKYTEQQLDNVDLCRNRRTNEGVEEMTPLQITMLLHYHVSPSDYREIHYPAQQDAIAYFLEAGFLEVNDKSSDTSAEFVATDKLHAYCEALCQVPEPVQAWVCGEYRG